MKLRYGPAMYQLLGIIAAGELPSISGLSDLARRIIGQHGKPISRQRAMQLVNLAAQDGLLDARVFPYHPQMVRASRRS